MASPNSYKDPYWIDLIDRSEKKVGVPTGWLKSIVLNGERSNKDQVSEAGASTVFQITPSTRKLVLDKYGIDPYLSDENAAESAALLLKESADRNKNNFAEVAGEYHGGTDRKNWGPRTQAYISRVTGGGKDTPLLNDFDKWAAQQGFSSNNAAQSAQVRQIGEDFTKSMAAKPKTAPSDTETAPSAAGTAPDVSGMLADFDQWEASKPAEAAPAQDLGIIGGIKESITGSQRATPSSQTLPEWTGMPELNQMSMASAKTGLGTMFAGPAEIVQVIQANYPNAQIRQDEKGNYIIKSSIDGQDYVIPPGVSIGDIPRILGGIAAFTPAGKAVSTLGMSGAKGLAAQVGTSAAASAATQAAIESTQAATGGEFNGGDVAAAGVVGGVLPPLAQGAKAITAPISRALSKAMGPRDAQMVESAAANVAPTPAPIAVPPVAAAPTVANVAQTATKAAEGTFGKEAAKKDLTAMVAPDRKTIEAAERMGTLEYLQPDHLSTSQAFRDISQAAKTQVGSAGRQQEVEGLAQVAKKADDVIEKLGGTSDLASVSSNVKKDLQRTHEEIITKEGALHDQVRDGIGRGTKVSVPETVSFLEQEAKVLGGVNKLSSLQKEVLGNLKGEPTYALVDKMRKKVGAASNMSSAFTNEDIGAAKHLYGIITKDQEVIAKAKGLDDIWETAKSATKLRKGIEDDLTALFGRNLDASIVGNISKSTSALGKGDTSKFLKLIDSIPKEMRAEVVASGINTVLKKNSVTNFSGYAEWYEGLLRNKQAHAAIMTNLPSEARKSLSDLYRVSRGIANASKERIPTGRVQTATVAFDGPADSLAGKLYEAAQKPAVAVAAGYVPVVGPVVTHFLSRAKTPAIRAVDKLISSPEFKETVLKFAKGQGPEAAKKLSKSKVFSEFVFKIGNPGEMSNRERWILQALEANSANQQQANSR